MLFHDVGRLGPDRVAVLRQGHDLRHTGKLSSDFAHSAREGSTRLPKYIEHHAKHG